MTYRPLRKDLTETTRTCNFCPNPLTSLKAYVLEEIKTGKLAYAGPTCARNNVAHGYSLEGLPDLTKFTIPNAAGSKGGGGGGGANAPATDEPRRRAVEYLMLREEKLVSDLGSFDVLRTYYGALKERDLTDREVAHVNNIEKKAPEKLKLLKLQRMYNYLFWLDVAVSKLSEEKVGFLSDIRTKVANGVSLSDQKHTWGQVLQSSI